MTNFALCAAEEEAEDGGSAPDALRRQQNPGTMAGKEKWVDVTQVLAKGTSSLRMGEMLHAPHFAVEQAMTSMQIGDPRMDLPVDKGHHVESLLESKSFGTPLTWAQTAQLLDCLAGKLAQWWVGSSLQLTIQSSLHLLGRDRLDSQPVVQAGMDLVLALVSTTRRIIESSCVIHVRHPHMHSAMPHGFPSLDRTL